jgi:hypothetical protein
VPRYCPNLMRRFYRPLTVLWLIAIALFVAGPPMGSVDVDNDGNPDIAVVVSAPRPSDVSRTRGTNDELQNAHNMVVTSVRIPAHNHDFETAAQDGCSVLHSCCVLRC